MASFASTMAGMPNSRATVARWLAGLPISVMRPLMLFKYLVKSIEALRATRTASSRTEPGAFRA